MGCSSSFSSAAPGDSDVAAAARERSLNKMIDKGALFLRVVRRTRSPCQVRGETAGDDDVVHVLQWRCNCKNVGIKGTGGTLSYPTTAAASYVATPALFFGSLKQKAGD